MTNIEKDMKKIVALSEIQGEIRRLDAIKYCFNKEYYDNIADGLALAIERLEKVENILKEL